MRLHTLTSQCTDTLQQRPSQVAFLCRSVCAKNPSSGVLRYQCMFLRSLLIHVNALDVMTTSSRSLLNTTRIVYVPVEWFFLLRYCLLKASSRVG